MANNSVLELTIDNLQKFEMRFYYKNEGDDHKYLVGLMTEVEACKFEELIRDLEAVLLQHMRPEDAYKTIIGHIKTIEATTYSDTALHKKAKSMLSRIKYILIPFYTKEEFELEEREKFNSSMQSLDLYVSEPGNIDKDCVMRLEQCLNDITQSASLLGISNIFLYQQLYYKLNTIYNKSQIARNYYRITDLLDQYRALTQ